jgi:hypothetical protein
MSRGAITYPTNRLLGVIDDPADARAALEALVVSGIARDDVTVMAGEDGLERVSRLGPPPSPLSRVIRAFQFMSMDQTPDFLVYEHALLDGRTVIAVRASDRDRMLEASAVLELHGAHFLNYFGRLSTEEVSMWRGEEPSIPDALRR